MARLESRAQFGINKNMVMGPNKNKLYKQPKTEEQKKLEKKNKFAGAFVMSPEHCKSTGFELLGELNKFIHDHAIDMDIGSESVVHTKSIFVIESQNEKL